MDRLSRHSQVFAALLACGVLAGCVEAPPPPPHEAVSHDTTSVVPQLAGAWYQVRFDSNKTDIDERGRMLIDRVVAVVTGNATTRVTVIGRADRVGNPTANLALSERRADQVRDALIAAGVPAARIDTRWTGESKQEVRTGNDVDEPRNRVVDITVVEETI